MNRQIITTTTRTARKRRPRRSSQVVVVSRPSGKSRRNRRARKRRAGRRSGVPRLFRNSDDYLRSLLEPERYTARVPDANGWNTTVFQTIIDTTLTTSSDGQAAMLLYPTPITPSQTNVYANLVGTGTTAGGVGVWTAASPISPQSSNAVINAMSMYRPVSGVALLEFIGTTGNDNGQVAAAPIFRGELGKRTFASLLQNQYSVAGPLRNGVRFLWKPMDEVDFQFIPAQAADTPGIFLPGGVGAPTGDPYPNTGITGGGQFGSYTTLTSTAIQLYVSGAQASTTVARVRWIVNYEATPELSSFSLFRVEKVPNNPSAMAQAMNVISQVPWGDVWQGVAGIGGAMLEQAVGSQLPSYLGSLAANGMSQVIRNRLGGGSSRPALRGVDLSID